MRSFLAPSLRFLHRLCVIHLTRSPTVLSETQRFLPERGSIKISPPTFYYWNKFRAAGPLPNAKPSSLMRLSFPLSVPTSPRNLSVGNSSTLFRRFHLHLPGLNAFQALFRFCLNAACIFNCMQSRLHASLFSSLSAFVVKVGTCSLSRLFHIPRYQRDDKMRLEALVKENLR